MGYITQTDFESFVSKQTVSALYDDENTGVTNVDELNDNLKFADAMVNASLARIAGVAIPLTITPIPDIIKMAALRWMKALSYERRPEYVREYGDKPRESAEKLCTEIVEAKLFVPEIKPANVGGLVIDGASRLVTTSPDGTRNDGDY